MFDHDVGLADVSTYQVKRADSDYFIESYSKSSQGWAGELRLGARPPALNHSLPTTASCTLLWVGIGFGVGRAPRSGGVEIRTAAFGIGRGDTSSPIKPYAASISG
jgi:hypothetical protein